MTDNPYAQPQDFQGDPEYLEPKTSVLAIVAFVVSLLGLIACCVPGVGPLGLLLGVLALVMIGASGGRKKGGGFAIAAIIIGLIAGLINVATLWGASVAGRQWAEQGLVLVEVDDRDLAAVQGRLVSAQAQDLTQDRLDAFASAVNADFGAQQDRPQGLVDAVTLMLEVGEPMQAAQLEAQGEYPRGSYTLVPLALRYERGPVLFMLVIAGSGATTDGAYTNIGYYDPNGDMVWLLPAPSGGGALPPAPGALPAPGSPGTPGEGEPDPDGGPTGGETGEETGGG